MAMLRWFVSRFDGVLINLSVSFTQLLAVLFGAYIADDMILSGKSDLAEDGCWVAILFFIISIVADLVNWFALVVIREIYRSANPLRAVFIIAVVLVSFFVLFPVSGGFLLRLIYSIPVMGWGSCVTFFVGNNENIRPSLLSGGSGYTKELRVLYASSSYMYVRLLADEKRVAEKQFVQKGGNEKIGEKHADGSKRQHMPIAQPLPLSAVQGYDDCKED